jgi:integrase
LKRIEGVGKGLLSVVAAFTRIFALPPQHSRDAGPALLGVLVTCALRRVVLSRMNCEHLAMRDGRWVFLDFKGKRNKTRSVAVPLWVKQAIDGWRDTAGIEKGPTFRRVSASGRVGEDGLTERAVWQLVREYAAQVGIGELAPHDLRRTAAKLCRSKGGELEQIQFLLGHESILTTEPYLGLSQRHTDV